MRRAAIDPDLAHTSSLTRTGTGPSIISSRPGDGDGAEAEHFQAEFAYDVTQDYGEAGYAGYRVADNVTAHAGFGVGVYHYFRDAAVTVAAGIVAPEALVPSFVSPLAVFLDGLGTMRHVINEHGDATTIEQQGQPSWVCDEAPDRALTRK